MYAKLVLMVFACYTLTSVNGQGNDLGNGIERNITDAEQLKKLDEMAKKMRSARIGGDLSNTDGFLKFGKYKYWVSETYMDWWDAYYICLMRDARLASKGIRDDTVFPLIRDYIVNLDKDSAPGIWVGLNDIVSEGNYIWSDGVISVSSNTKWDQGEPNNDGNQDCAQVTQYYQILDDAKCEDLNRALCEYDA